MGFSFRHHLTVVLPSGESIPGNFTEDGLHAKFTGTNFQIPRDTDQITREQINGAENSLQTLNA